MCLVKNKDGEAQALVRVEEGIKEGESVSDNNSSSSRFVSKAAVEVSILIILGLSLHSAFEGITIGLAEYDRYAWRYLWTICIHKVVLALSLGIVVLRMQPKRPILTNIAYSFAFAISTPIGIIVSLLIQKTAQNGASDWVYVLTQAVACGVFLHISIYHILAKGFNPQDQSSYTTPFRRFFALFLGMLIVTIGLLFN
ncbi:Zinc transporter 1 [Heracleum sosnowskyi]|uniref:Zinc transporter 1 n=1 Tax=Heracleum sosnowskyi TaxID=360622 RepID=A0AAD8M1K3_9APIA|nr:Zinc transporter 1 [Heracleum sosnowskyi]